MPHVPQKFYRVGSQQKLSAQHKTSHLGPIRFRLDLLLKLVKHDLEKKHPCLIFCNQTKTVQFLQQFFRDNRIEILTLHSQMTDTVGLSVRRRPFFNFRSFRNEDEISNNFVSEKI